MNEYLKKYINQGFYVFPCKKSDIPEENKRPAALNGFKDATNNFDEFYNIKNRYANITGQNIPDDQLLIGLPTGNINGLVVVDLDVGKTIRDKYGKETGEIDPRNADELLEALREYGPVPDTYIVETPSGGRHLYFSISETQLTTRSWSFDKTLPVDIRANGGYACAPDGVNGYIVYDDFDDLGIDNLRSRCASLPEWIEQHQQNRQQETLPEPLHATLPANEIKEIRSALSYIPSDDRDLWLSIGFALKNTGSPAAFGLWNEWSQLSMDNKYNAADMPYRWKTLKPNGKITIASIFYEAKKYGWTAPNTKEIQIISSEVTKNKPIKDFKKKLFPEKLLRPPGLVGDIIDFILEKSIQPQPIFALSAALCAVGTLAGRKYQTPTGIRTNIYCVNVGGSGSGKDAPRKAIKELFQAANCRDMVSVAKLASDTSIITALDQQESSLFLLDEIGKFILTAQNGPSHIVNIITVLLELYSSANQIYDGKNYADANKKITIIQPNLCLLGTTVPDTFYQNLSLENVTDGFLSRILIFETDNNRPRKDRNKNFLGKPDKDLVDKVKTLLQKPINMDPDGNLDTSIPNPQTVHLNENADLMLTEFEDYIFDLRNKLAEKQKEVETVYNRTEQFATQIALILAIGQNPDTPVITEKDMSYGINLSIFLADHMRYIVENHMARNNYEHEVKRVKKIIRERGKISNSQLTQLTQNLPGHVRSDIIDTLIASDEIAEQIVVNESYQTTMYISI